MGGVGAAQQKSWDSIHAGFLVQQLTDEAGDEVSHPRLLAVSTKESGAWPATYTANCFPWPAVGP